jgi:hypothetical protein
MVQAILLPDGQISGQQRGPGFCPGRAGSAVTRRELLWAATSRMPLAAWLASGLDSSWMSKRRGGSSSLRFNLAGLKADAIFRLPKLDSRQRREQEELLRRMPALWNSPPAAASADDRHLFLTPSA